MNKRYIDFVPSKSTNTTKKSGRSSLHVEMPTPQPKARQPGTKSRSKHPTPPHRSLPSRGPATKVRAASQQSVNVRRSSTPRPATRATINKPTRTPQATYQPASHSPRSNVARPTPVRSAPMNRPRPNRPTISIIEDSGPKFVNTNVPKRPLNQAGAAKVPASKRALRHPSLASTTAKPTHTSKTQNAPAAIIEKPKKESRVGLIITIIITIILGAAAGTVAFLLLPK